MNKINESGRSMVEMLGVLAIMGVLSVGGVAMYSSAMKKYRTNELLNEFYQRASTVAAHIVAGQSPENVSLAEFSSHDNLGYATFSQSVEKVGNSQFKLKLSSVPETGICAQMKSAIGPSTAFVAVADDCSSVTFNNDLSTGNAGSSESNCEPHCTWTEWFDVDYPIYEEGGGDFETYEKIRAAGGAVCEQPQEIKCEAEDYPGLRVEQVGQRVHCDVRFGFICRNEEQPGLFKMCINYRISVLCCSSHCIKK